MQKLITGGSGCVQRAPVGRLSPTRKHLAAKVLEGGLNTRCSRSFATVRNSAAEAQSRPGGFLSERVTSRRRPFKILIREATLSDFWEVADTHCGAFLPELVFPMDAIMRLDRVLAMVGGLPLPAGCQRKCLVAVSDQCHDGPDHAALIRKLVLHGPNLFEAQSQMDDRLPSVLGAITVDTLADFIPRKKSTGSRRTGIAYVSNVAVHQAARRAGIGKRLVQAAEMIASEWGCSSIALHCDKLNLGAVALYVGAGYKAIKIPVDAKWPQPKHSPGSQFGLMLKRLGSL